MLAINGYILSITGISPFFTTHSYNIKPIKIKEPLRAEGKTPVTQAEVLISKLREVIKVAQIMIAAAQERYEGYANQNRQLSDQFRVGDKVWLNLQNMIINRPSKKLDWQNAKYTVTELVRSHAVHLDTPPGIHNMFHIMLLQRAASNPLPTQITHEPQPPAIITDDGIEEYEIDKILNYNISRGKRKHLRLLVK
jgi:hypothetical protein